MGHQISITMVAAGIVILAIVVLGRRRRLSDSSKRERPNRGQVLLAILGSLMLAIGLRGLAVLRDRHNDSVSERPASAITPIDSDPAKPAPTSPVAPLNPDEQLRPRVIGVWTDNYQGKRTMTLNEDGTGTILAELTGLTAKLYAERLRFDIVWQVEDGCLIKKTTGGEPAGKVALILTAMGDRAEEPIQAITRDRLILLDQNGVTTYTWVRSE